MTRAGHLGGLSPSPPRAGLGRCAAMIVQVALFEVAPGEDEALLAGWAQARAFLHGREGFADATLYRSVAVQADFRYVGVAHVASIEAWRQAIADPAFPLRELPGTPHPNLYEVVRAEPDRGEDEPAMVLVTAIAAPDDGDEVFLPAWERANGVLRSRPGYCRSRLLRSVAPGAEFRFVVLTGWDSAEACEAAVRSRAFRAAIRSIPHPAHPGLYEAVSRWEAPAGASPPRASGVPQRRGARPPRRPGVPRTARGPARPRG